MDDDRLGLLRRWLRAHGIDWLIVVRGDRYHGEHLAPHDEHLRWLTGFTGSHGQALIGHKHAFLYTDGRYSVQVREEVMGYTLRHISKEPMRLDLEALCGAGEVLAVDGWRMSVGGLKVVKSWAGGLRLKVLKRDPFAHIWRGRPAPPASAVVAFTGSEMTVESKCAQVAAQLEQDGVDAMVLTRGDSIAWLLNVRSTDVAYDPVVQSYALVHRDGSVDWFTRARTLPPLAVNVRVWKLSEFRDRLQVGTVGLEAASVPVALAALVPEKRWVADPCRRLKQRKSPMELAGMRRAHLLDGVALVRLLSRLDRDPASLPDEQSVVAELARLRGEASAYRGPSFETIAGSGPHGAIVHYRVTPERNRRLCAGDVLLLDSGGHYDGGTTDVTRTMVVGSPEAQVRRHYTLVLRGHVSLARVRFPRGVTGGQLDSLARVALWEEGLDYDHSTGHGVGCYLNVHEGPVGIGAGNTTALEEGMVVSNEPGYYREGAYGIRIENLEAVREVETGLLGFETLTLCPYARVLIDVSLLTAVERAHIDGYHRWVEQTLRPHLEATDRAWLRKACAPLEA